MNGKIAKRIRKIIYRDTEGKEPKREYKIFGTKQNEKFIGKFIANVGKRFNYQMAKKKYYEYKRKGENIC